MASSTILAFYIAGFLFSQTCDVISGNPARPLTPVAIVVHGSDQQFRFFEGETLQEMVDSGRQELKSKPYDAWALSYEGYAVAEGHRRSALFVESWSKSAAKPVTLVQFFLRSENGSISFLGSPLLISEGGVPEASSMTSVVPREMTAEQQFSFQQGILRQKELKEKGYIGDR
jgi:hypothetical protein